MNGIVPKKKTESEWEAELVARSRPKPLPKRHRLNAGMRERLLSVDFVHEVFKSPFASDDELLGWSRLIQSANTFEVGIYEEERSIGSLSLHTMLMGVDADLHDMADATTNVPHWPIGDVFYGSFPTYWVMDEWEVGCGPDDHFMVVGNVHLTEEWQGWGLEPVFTGLAMQQIRRWVPNLRFALAYPVYWWQRGEEKRFAQVVYERSFNQLGFYRLRRGSETWIMPDFFRYFDDAARRLRDRLRLPGHLFEYRAAAVEAHPID